jgi:hypothetical protein
MTDIETMLAERGKRYGKFTGQSEVAQALKETMRAHPNHHDLAPDQKEALDMIQHKIGRILNGDPDYVDSWDDIVGYAKLVADRLKGDPR